MTYNLFRTSRHAQAYTKYRPVYPNDIYTSIEKYCTGGRGLAVDIGCGEGRSTIPLSRYFDKVIGLDLSETQLEEARTKIPANRNVVFTAGQAEDLSFLKDCSVDLVTFGNSMHWMDMSRVNKEVVRVLRPGGAVALFQYKEQTFDRKEANDFMTEMFESKIIPMSNLPEERIRFTAADYHMPINKDRRREDYVMQHDWTVEEFANYYDTISYIAALRWCFPDTTIFEDMKDRLKSIYTDVITGKESRMHVQFEVTLVMGRK